MPCTASYVPSTQLLRLSKSSAVPLVAATTSASLSAATRFHKVHTGPHYQRLKSKPTQTDDEEESYIIDIERAPEPDIDFSGTAEGNSFLFNEKKGGALSELDADALTLWRQTRTMFPPIVTGAWDANTKYTDNNPWGAIYNMFFVRVPVLVGLAVYLKNLLVDGHGFVVNFGYNVGGNMVVSPLLVLGVAYLMLGPLLVQKDEDEE